MTNNSALMMLLYLLASIEKLIKLRVKSNSTIEAKFQTPMNSNLGAETLKC